MKKSNLLLGVAVVFFMGCLMAFNFALKAEYKTGRYKDRFLDYVTQDFKGFDAVKVNGAANITVRIIQGDYQVKFHKKAKNYLQVKKEGNALVLDVNQANEREQYQGEVIISMPQLTSVETSSTYTLLGKKEMEVASEYVYEAVSIEGFELDSLTILQDHATSVKLGHNKIGNLTVLTGSTQGSTGKLYINKTNSIQKAHFDIRNKSILELDNVMIPAVSYQFSDSATANFNGASLQLLTKK